MAQLNPGDIMFTAFNADGDDAVAWVALEDIPANTTIYFTDNEWNGVDSFSTGEGFVSWEHTGLVTAGTVIALNSIMAQ